MTAKYVRTAHLPWPMGGTADDERITSVDHFIGQHCRISEKLDGENNDTTQEAVFARSHSSPASHPSNNWIKQQHQRLRHLIDPNLSVFVEYTYALHSIWYRKMAQERAYLHVIAVRDNSTKLFWSTSDTDLMAQVLDLPTVPVLFEGVIESEAQLKKLMPGSGRDPSCWGGVPTRYVLADFMGDGAGPHPPINYTPSTNIREGEVIRVTREFYQDEAKQCLAKTVRPGHVTSPDHWKSNWMPMHEWDPEK